MYLNDSNQHSGQEEVIFLFSTAWKYADCKGNRFLSSPLLLYFLWYPVLLVVPAGTGINADQQQRIKRAYQQRCKMIINTKTIFQPSFYRAHTHLP